MKTWTLYLPLLLQGRHNGANRMTSLASIQPVGAMPYQSQLFLYYFFRPAINFLVLNLDDCKRERKCFVIFHFFGKLLFLLFKVITFSVKERYLPYRV